MSKTILITGASSGIGKATAKYFQEKGWNVAATMRTPEKEDELTNLENVLVTRLDVQDLSSIDKAIKDTLDRFGTIDVIVNNAGYAVFGPIESTSREKIIRQFDVNVIGLIDVTKAIIPYFRNRGEGTIINITSVGGKITFPFVSLYHGTKFAVEGISEAMYFEMKQIGCKVKIVEPGAIRTNFDQSMDINNDENISEYQEMMKKLMAVMEPMLENGSEPEVVAEVIYEAATDGSDQLRYIAGEDAKEWIKNRKEQDDESFMAGTKQMIGL